MTLITLHDLSGNELYVDPSDVNAIAKSNQPFPAGTMVILNGGSVEVRESPGAILYILRSLPSA